MRAVHPHHGKVGDEIANPISGFDFSNQVALVTGSTIGIGESCARAFATAGANFVVTSRNTLRGGEIVEEMVTEGREVHFEASDMNDWSSGEQLVSACVERWGRLDNLVNNVGILHGSTAIDTTLETWNETLRVNLTAVFVLSRLAIPTMPSRVKNASSTSLLNGD